MSKPTAINHSTLSWVKKELDVTLKQAADALEAYSEDNRDTTQLSFCGTHLHQVHGILQMLELFGAAMLVEEMEQTVEALLQGKVSDIGDALEALMRAILQLPDYLERVQSGVQDTAILNLPLLNDLRSVRGANLLTENALFSPDLDSAADSARHIRRPGKDLAALAKKRRHDFQLGLLGVLRERSVKKSLERMLGVLDALDQASDDDQTGTLWWVAAGLVEALQQGSLESSSTTKMLLGQVDRQLKRAIDQGEVVFSVEPPRDLIKNLLYYVARSEPVGERVPAIQHQYRLKELLVDEDEIARTREGLSGPNADILQTVADAIKEDLAGVKDTLDLYVRGGSKDQDKLSSVADTLRRVGDTLGVLGLGVPRRVVKEQTEIVESMAGGAGADDQQLMSVAEALLYVESALDGLTRNPQGDHARLFGSESDSATDRARSEQELSEIEFRKVYGDAITEAITEVGRIKETIVRFIESESTADLQGIDENFASVYGALSMLGLPRAAALMKAASAYLADKASTNVPPSAELDTLADAITSLEYYLEAVREDRDQPERILDVAAESLAQLGQTVDAQFDEGAVDDAASATEPDFDLDFSDLEDAAPAQQDTAEELPALDEEPEIETEPAAEQAAGDFETADTPDQQSEEAAAPEAEPVAEEAPVEPKKTGRINYDVPLLAGELDDDILEIFLEEADEVLETLGTEFPAWRANPDNADALTTCRRMFHTLKGSGRLAGALLLGELAWTQENLLNRVLEKSVAPGPELFAVIGDALDVFPALVAAIKTGTAPEADVHGIMRRAEVIADPSRRQELEADAAQEAPETQASEPVAEEAAAEEVVLEPAEDATDSELAPEEFEIEVSASEAEAFEQDLDTEVETEQQQEIEPAAEAEELDLGDFELPAEPEQPEADSEEVVLDIAAIPELADEVPAEPGLETEDAVVEAAAEDDAPAEPEDDAELGPAVDASTGLMDPVLYDIFSRETADHLGVVRAFIEDCGAGDGAYPVGEDLVRALHTLTGSARMADVEPIARLGRSLERYSELCLTTERPFRAADLELVERGVGLIEEQVRALGDAGLSMPDTGSVLAALDSAYAAAEAETGPAQSSPLHEEDFEEPEARAVPVEAPEPIPSAPMQDVDPDLVELFLEEATDILEFLETTVQRWEDEPDHSATIAELHRSLHTLKGGARLAGFAGIGALCHVLESVSGDVADHKVPADDAFFNVLHAALDRLGDMVEQAKQGASPEAPEDIMAQIGDLRGERAAPEAMELAGADVELLEVFLEEATEILEATEGALHRWQEAPDDFDLITELQRALHTLKGGARMAGLAQIGNLSHALETLLIGVLNGKPEATAELFELLEQVHDRLFQMRERAQQGEKLEEAEDLLAAIEAMRTGKQAAAGKKAAKSPAKDPAAAVAELKPAAKPREEAGRDESRAQHDQIRVRADLLDNLVNYAGEVSIYRARLEQQVGAMRFNLTEFDQTVNRLREQLRTLEIETEAQILYRFERENEVVDLGEDEDFDPLELDRFSHIQELSRALSESVNDLVSIQGLLDHLSRESETLLLQQSRVNTDLQDGLMRTRMVPFANLVPRMRRIVRQTCQELGKHAQFKVLGAQGEMDRTVLERVIPPMEHMLRNAVAHGIESPEQRTAAGKVGEGSITVSLAREGADVVIRVADDGGGINLEAIRRKAVAQGLMPEGAPLTDREIMQFILEAGFSTAEQVTQIAGRGVGMDVVSAEIKQLGGTLEIDSVEGQGTTFTVRLPFTLAINQALLCQAGEEVYALPLSSIEGVVRMTHEELEHCFKNPHQAFYDYAGERYDVRSLAGMLGVGEPILPGPGKRAPMILVQTGDHRLAVQVDGLLGSREIVVKSVGPQISTVPGIYGATILADGRVVLILDVSALVRIGVTYQQPVFDGAADTAKAEEESGKVTVMVVDDSITMRKVATRLLERNGMNVVTAKDGVDAVAQLQEVLPDAMLLDIEMPRMDGYELATHMRNDTRLREVPIIMITSRTGDKHRQRAMEIGVNRYLGKPYQESELLENLRELLEERRGGE